MENYFKQLNAINVSDKIERKGNLSYLSWAYAWGELKKIFPTANYKIYENADGWNYFTDGRTCWVKTGVTVEGIEHIEYLPVLNFKNAPIPSGEVTSFDVNKAIQRSLTKAVARHGLGLYIYAGEDLPEIEKPKEQKEQEEKSKNSGSMMYDPISMKYIHKNIDMEKKREQIKGQQKMNLPFDEDWKNMECPF